MLSFVEAATTRLRGLILKLTSLANIASSRRPSGTRLMVALGNEFDCLSHQTNCSNCSEKSQMAIILVEVQRALALVLPKDLTEG